MSAMGDPPGRCGRGRLDRGDDLAHVRERARHVADGCALVARPAHRDERPGDVGGVVEEEPPAVVDVVAVATGCSSHRVGRLGRDSLVARRSEHVVRTEPEGRHALVLPVDAGASLVRLLVDAVVRRRVRIRLLVDARPDSASAGPKSAAELANTIGAVIRSRRPFTASKTFTVPTTFTAAPSDGSARQNGICRAARWMTCVISRSSRTRSSSARVGDVALDERDTAHLSLAP